jgi:serine/threonine protein kinase
MQNMKRIGKYELVKIIGRGSYAEVWEAKDIETYKIYAVKKINSSLLSDQKRRENIKREINLLNSLQNSGKKEENKNINRIVDLLMTEKSAYIVLEYCNGGDLYQYCQNYKLKHKINLPERIVQKIVRQIVDGIKFIHSKNVMHRDLKLENILINFDDRFLISDQ